MQFRKGLYNVELHHHLDGCCRSSTIKDLAAKKNFPNFDASKFDENLRTASNLPEFLDLFELFIPVLQGDAEAIERIAYESVEDAYNNKIAYFETRFAPHLLLPGLEERSKDGVSACCLHDVVDAVIDGLERGEKQFGVQCRIILVSLRGQESWLLAIKQLLKHYRHNPYIVGVDIAGNENMPWTDEELALTGQLYDYAKEIGFGRTIHAGEQGLHQSITQAIDVIGVDRIGHGYALHTGPVALMEQCKQMDMHFEYCPISSKILNSLGCEFHHSDNPIKLGIKQKLNFSLNCDDSIFFGHLNASQQICKEVLGFTEEDIHNANLNAARSSFLSTEKKAALLKHIQSKP